MAELLEKAGELELDFDTNEGKKKAAADFLAIVEGKLDVSWVSTKYALLRVCSSPVNR